MNTTRNDAYSKLIIWQIDRQNKFDINLYMGF